MADETKPADSPAPPAVPTPAPSPVVAAAGPVAGADEAKRQRAKDLAYRAEHPNEPLVRAANPNVGGEKFPQR